MPVLSPTAAANIASAVYEVETSKSLKKELLDEDPFALGVDFEFRPEGITKGKSGPTWAPQLLSQSGFGYVAKGKGAFAGDVLVAFRGTNFIRGRDVWTDGNFSVQKGPRGYALHGGFNNTFNSFLPQLRQQLQGLNPTRIHLVGHSLGGALATVAMDWCLQEGSNKMGQPYLYTFGSPRVGMESFADALTNTATAQCVHRVYHSSDVVSMIPLFPFTHVPLPGASCVVSRSGLLGSPLAISTHFMDTYIKDVAGKDWNFLRSAGAKALMQQQAESMMKRELLSMTVGRFSTTVLHAINSALGSLLNKAGQVIGCGLVGGMTILDRLVWTLERLAKMGGELMVEVGHVLYLALRFMGVQTVKLGKLSFEVIRDVMYKLFSTVHGMARMAIEAVASRS